MSKTLFNSRFETGFCLGSLTKLMTQYKSVNYGNTNVKIVLNASKREAGQAFQSSWGINQNMFESTYVESWILCYHS